MATESYALPTGARRRPRAELVLALLALASLALIPVRITTIYSGLPAHPLFLHVPVLLIPVVTVGALVLAARPRLIARYGVGLATLAVVALAATFLTIGAGIALREALHLNGATRGGFVGGIGPAALIARHAHAASILRLLMIAFTAVLIITVLAYRVSSGLPTGGAVADRELARAGTRLALRAVLAALAIACAYFVFHTGDLGAKAAWQGRLNNAGRLGAPPGFGVPPTGGTGTPPGLRR